MAAPTVIEHRFEDGVDARDTDLVALISGMPPMSCTSTPVVRISNRPDESRSWT